MLKVEDYGKIRRAHRDGMSIREIARTFGHSRRKIRQVLQEPEPRPYTRRQPADRPKLTEPIQQRIDEILAADESAPRKQRHTAVMIHRRLVAEGYAGGYDQVRRFVAGRRQTHRETFLPLEHHPGQRAEADFGHIYVDFPTGRRQVPVLIITWAWSNRAFAIAMPSEKVEAILHGTVEAFNYFGCVPKELWWDNPKTVAITILSGRQREMNTRYQALASHYNFEPLFCMPARGNEKPHVENRVKYLQRNWATPVPRARDLDELNQHLRDCCERDQDRTSAGHSETIGARFEQERASALPLPARSFDAAVEEARKVDKYQTVAWEKNRYSVPRRDAFATVSVKAYVDRIVVVSQGQVIAQHERSYNSGEQVLDPLHYLAMLERKPACLDHSPVYSTWKLPADFSWLRGQLEQRHGRLPGARQYIRVLQLLGEHPIERVREAIAYCRRDTVVTADRVRHRCQWLAAAAFANAAECNDNSLTKQIRGVDVPLPDLKKFDSLFTPQFTQGRERYDETRPSATVESEPQATAPADDAGGIREAGQRSGGERPGLSAILVASDGTGVGNPEFQRAASADPSGRLSGA